MHSFPYTKNQDQGSYNNEEIIVQNDNMKSVNQSMQLSSEGQLQQILHSKRNGSSQGGVMQSGENGRGVRNVNIMVENYRKSLQRPRDHIVTTLQQQNNQILSFKAKQNRKHHNNSSKIKTHEINIEQKLIVETTLNRDSSSELGLIKANINQGAPTSSSNKHTTLLGQVQRVNHLNGSPSQKIIRPKGQSEVPSSRNNNGIENILIKNESNQSQIGEQRMNRDLSRGLIDKKQSISFEGNIKIKLNNNEQINIKNPYLAQVKNVIKNHKNAINKMKIKQFTVINNNSNAKTEKKKDIQIYGLDQQRYNESSKVSPKNKNAKKHLNISYEKPIGILPELKNSKIANEKSPNRDDSVNTRKDIIKKEYNRMLSTKLPNIFHIMNQERSFNDSTGVNSTLNENIYEDYETQLLSIVMNKDKSKKLLNLSEQKDYKHRKIYQKGYQQQAQLTSSHSQDKIYGDNIEKPEVNIQQVVVNRRKSNHQSSFISKQQNADSQYQDYDDDLIKLGRLQLINANARYELLNANRSMEQTNQEQKQKQSKGKAAQKSLVALIRHGERADFAGESYDKWDIPFDPPLTSIGVKQAEETGQYLQKYLSENHYDQVIIECSPFLRTMQTAAAIAKGIGHSKFRINYKYSEKLCDYYFNENPIDQLNIKVMDRKNLVERHLSGIDFEDTTIYYNEIKKVWPESRSEAKNRMFAYAGDLVKEYSQTEKKVAHFIITHGYFVATLSEHFNGYKPYANYCSITGFTVLNEQVQLTFDTYSKHIKSWGEDCMRY